jgi:glutaredoxin
MAKEYLASKNIPFTEVDVSTDRAQQEALVKKTGQYGVPVIEVDGRIIIGFDRAKLNEFLSADKAGAGIK